jgi:hypothetical protein
MNIGVLQNDTKTSKPVFTRHVFYANGNTNDLGSFKAIFGSILCEENNQAAMHITSRVGTGLFQRTLECS